jgi:hypothetical protein
LIDRLGITHADEGKDIPSLPIKATLSTKHVARICQTKRLKGKKFQHVKNPAHLKTRDNELEGTNDRGAPLLQGIFIIRLTPKGLRNKSVITGIPATEGTVKARFQSTRTLQQMIMK